VRPVADHEYRYAEAWILAPAVDDVVHVRPTIQAPAEPKTSSE
jgi:hypothetical protein